MAIIGVVATAKNLAIGKDGKLPWHYSDDLKFFKRTTNGHSMVMGYSTWVSIGKRLPGRLSIVLSNRAEKSDEPGVIFINTVESVVELASFLAGDLFVIGGGMTFKSFSKVMDGWIVTEIPESIEDADVFMPSKFLDGFVLEKSEKIGEGLIAKYYEKEGKG